MSFNLTNKYSVPLEDELNISPSDSCYAIPNVHAFPLLNSHCGFFDWSHRPSNAIQIFNINSKENMV